MKTPHRDERESLQRRLTELQTENARLLAERAAIPPVRQSDWGSLTIAFVIACLIAMPFAGCVGCVMGLEHQAGQPAGQWQH